MMWAYWAVDAFVVVNFLSFTLLSTKLFRLDHAGRSSYVFFASFLAGTCTSVWYMFHGTRPGSVALIGAVAAATLSCVLFVTAARVISAKPLTAIFSTDQPTFLHSSGPYRLMRHPFYVAYVLNFLAAYLSSSNPITLALFFAAAAVYGYAAKIEERKFDQSPLAAEYRAYKKSTGWFKQLTSTKND